MDDRKSFISGSLIGCALTIMTLNVIAIVDHEEPTYTVEEDNAVETVISIQHGDDTTLLSINRFEDGGGLWITEYDGKSVPESIKIESVEKQNENQQRGK